MTNDINKSSNNQQSLSFDSLAATIQKIHAEMAAQAGRAVNASLTLRNWLIGCYIAEFELRGRDRAEYGENLLSKLAERLHQLKVSACGKRRLYFYLRFYHMYPGIVRSATAQLQSLIPEILTPTPEIECIRGNWSVRELKRQINSLYYERSGLSHDKNKLSEVREEYGQYDICNHKTVTMN